MRLAATVIIYNPPKNFIDNIYTYIDDIEKLYIFDNSSDKSFEIPNEILDKSEYFHSGNNEGNATVKLISYNISISPTDSFGSRSFHKIVTVLGVANQKVPFDDIIETRIGSPLIYGNS